MVNTVLGIYLSMREEFLPLVRLPGQNFFTLSIAAAFRESGTRTGAAFSVGAQALASQATKALFLMQLAGPAEEWSVGGWGGASAGWMTEEDGKAVAFFQGILGGFRDQRSSFLKASVRRTSVHRGGSNLRAPMTGALECGGRFISRLRFLRRRLPSCRSGPIRDLPGRFGIRGSSSAFSEIRTPRHARYFAAARSPRCKQR